MMHGQNSIEINLSASDQEEAFQLNVEPWLRECFAEAANDVSERTSRFLEEALELAQASGCTAEDAHRLVDYVFGRPVGDKNQEAGAVMLTLAALCIAHGLNMHVAGRAELARVSEPQMMQRIRAKHLSRPQNSPLPGAIS